MYWEQIEEVTSGHIPLNLIRTTLSIGVGLAIALSMVRLSFLRLSCGIFFCRDLPLQYCCHLNPIRFS